MASFSEANAVFALDIFQMLTKNNPSENIVFSPANLTAGLGMLLLGSQNDTAAHIENILHLDELTECKAQGRRRYLAPTRSYDCSTDKLKTNVLPCASSTTALFSEDVKPRPSSGAVSDGSPTGSNSTSEPACPYHEVPNYECDKPEGTHTGFHKILAALNKLTLDYDVDIANRMYASDNIVFIQKFLYCALKLYLTEVDRVDIQNAPEEVRKLINLWVEVQTHGMLLLWCMSTILTMSTQKISSPRRMFKDILPKDRIDCNAKLLLVNAFCFKGQWELQFDKAFTQEGVFYLNEKDSTTVQFMYQVGQYNIGTIEECKAQVIEIPYRNKELSLFLLLPQDTSISSLQKLENKLTGTSENAEKLLKLSSALKLKEVEVVIPKFSVKERIELTVNLDLSTVVDPKKADLSSMTTTKDVALTQLTHNVVFEVDEDGGAKVCPCHKEKHIWDPLNFVADRPFIFFGIDKSTQSIVIFGRYIKPESK